MAITRRGRAVAASLGALLTVGGALTVRSALDVADSSSGAEPGAIATTPVFAARRVPELWRASVAEHRLGARLESAVSGPSACVAASVDGVPVGAVAPATTLAPASTLKILTAVAVLEALGPDATFTTELRGPNPDADGTIAGDLHLVGGGDPTLATPRYEEYVRGSDRLRLDPLTPLQGLVDQLVAAGVQRIDGAVIGDGRRYDGPTFLPVWKPNYRPEGQVGPIGALTVNHGFADFPPPVPVDDPAAYAAEQLTVLLQRAAIEVTDAPASGATPADAPVLASLVSPPLSDIAAAMLTSSDNTTAELLLRELARSTGGPATTEAGTAALVRTIASLDVDVNGAAPLDGSGLAPDDRLSCTTLLDALELADPAVDEGLADAGSTGTLATRFIGHPLEGALHAKTGQINGVVGFAGLIDGEGERPTLRFAFLANGDFDTEAGQALQVAVVDALASYPDAPPASDLVPDSE